MTKQRIAGRCALIWRKEFLPGAIFEGINLWERLEFVDRWHCAQWIKGVRRNIRKGSLEWRFSEKPTTAMVIRATSKPWPNGQTNPNAGIAQAYPNGRWP